MTRHLRFRLSAALAVLLAAPLALAQSGGPTTAARTAPQAGVATPAPSGQRPAVVPPTASAGAEGQPGYTYRSEGRRDPFVSLWNPASGGTRQATKAESVASLYTNDLQVKGILQSRGQFVAIVVGPGSKRQFILHPNDRLADGVVKAINADSVLILQQVSDPLSHARQREIRKTLRAVEEVK
jgi:hypothetical protein